jgi:hypothetical protein
MSGTVCPRRKPNEFLARLLPPQRVDAFLAFARSELGGQVTIYLQPQHWISADLGQV